MINDLKKVTQSQIVSKSDVYGVYLGTFFENAFTWYLVKEFKNLTEAYKEFKKYVNTQLKYTDEELVKVWDTGRLDIELRQGSKLLNWVGIYCREAQPLDKKEEKEVEKGKIEKPKAKDSVDVPPAIRDKWDKIERVCNYVCERALPGFNGEGGYKMRSVYSPHHGAGAHAPNFDYMIIIDVVMNNEHRLDSKNQIYTILKELGYTLNDKKNGYRITAYI